MKFSKPKGITTYHTTAYPLISSTLLRFSAAGKFILITGGGAGLGLAFAEQFAQAGCTRIATTGRRIQALKYAKTKLEIEHSGVEVLVLPGDVTDIKSVETAFKTTRAVWSN
jgi:NAD(P)-dependent dehydrogenase (short-subunit alcohol dehydrogenase family)